MKKRTIFIMIGLFFAGIPLFAQFGLQAGAAFSSAKEKAEGVSVDFTTKTGFTGGFFYRHEFAGKFAVQPELNFMQKGGKYSESMEGEGGTYDLDIDLTLNYLELPVYLLYNGGKSTGFYGGVGPSFNWGLSGKAKYNGESEDVKFGNDEDLKPFFMGVSGMIGYQMPNGLNFNGFITQSITNSDTNTEMDSKFNMLTFGIRIGFIPFFNQKTETKAPAGL